MPTLTLPRFIVGSPAYYPHRDPIGFIDSTVAIDGGTVIAVSADGKSVAVRWIGEDYDSPEVVGGITCEWFYASDLLTVAEANDIWFA